MYASGKDLLELSLDIALALRASHILKRDSVRRSTKCDGLPHHGRAFACDAAEFAIAEFAIEVKHCIPANSITPICQWVEKMAG
jgi:hypothetical protein